MWQFLSGVQEITVPSMASFGGSLESKRGQNADFCVPGKTLLWDVLPG